MDKNVTLVEPTIEETAKSLWFELFNKWKGIIKGVGYTNDTLFVFVLDDWSSILRNSTIPKTWGSYRVVIEEVYFVYDP